MQPQHSNAFQVLRKKDLTFSESSIFVHGSLRRNKLRLNFENNLILTQPSPERERNPGSKILRFQQHVNLTSLLEACIRREESSSCKSFPPDFMDFSPKITAFEDLPLTLCSPLAASTLVIWYKGWYFKMLWFACTTLLTIFWMNVAVVLHMAVV